MVSRNLRILRMFYLMIVVCLFSLPAHAKYGGGTGEPNDPYEIATAEELILLSESPEDYDKYFILTANIDLDPNLPGGKVFDRAVIAADTDDVERGFQGTYFTGVFDGNGHTVSRITIRGDDYLGLFGWLEYESEIRDLGVVNINIIGSGHRVGGLIGWNLGGRLVNCYSTGTVNGDSYVGGLIGAVDLGGSIINCYSTSTVSGSGEVGGLLGWNLYGSIINCYSTGTVSGHGAVGGLVGVNKGEINNCYSTSMVSGESLVGGLVGNHQYLSTITNCYATGSVTGTRYVGGLVGVNDLWGEDRLGEVIFSFWDVETSGQTTSAGGTGKTTAEMQDPNTFMASGWNFVGKSDGPSDIWAEPAGGGYPILWFQPSPLSELPAFSEGAGEPNNPYLISTASDLNSIGHNPRLMDGHFMLTNDIDLAGIDFYIIGSKTIPFTGVFDGNGFMVSNLSYASADTHYVGLFGHVYRPGKIKDLGLSDPNIDAGAGHYVSSLVGYLLGGNIKNSYVQDGSVTGTTYVGGLVGRNCSGTITNCYSSAAVSGIWVIGGLVGYIDYEGGIIN
ncbi:MAG: GLUG motif-containing protein, partial [Phycisphaerales bacterium]